MSGPRLGGKVTCAYFGALTFGGLNEQSLPTCCDWRCCSRLDCGIRFIRFAAEAHVRDLPPSGRFPVDRVRNVFGDCVDGIDRVSSLVALGMV
jgi:hypothetical protein